MKQTLTFFVRWALIGLAVACVVLVGRNLFERDGQPVAAAESAPPAAGRNEKRRSFADAVAKAAPAVVNIYTARVVSTQVRPRARGPEFGQSLPAMRSRVESSLGSGVIVDATGHIITNHHVIKDASQMRVQLADGRLATPRVVGTDPDTDLAVLRVDLPNLPTMSLGHSDELRPGDMVLAIGNPLGLSQTVTQGIVSATGRGNLRLATFADFIQTDAAINFGNSGGALIDTEGRLVGINTAVLAQALGTEGIGFAIPVNLVRGVMEEIIVHGRVRRGWLGVHVMVDPVRRFSQPIIDAIDPGSPAERAGLRRGDLIVQMNGKQVLTDQDALTQVAALAPGSDLQISVRRGDATTTMHATLEERRMADTPPSQ